MFEVHLSGVIVRGPSPGCGCLLMVVAFVALVTITLVTTAYLFVKQTSQFLDTKPKPLAIPHISELDEDRIVIVDRTFRSMVDDGQAGSIDIDSLTLNGWMRITGDPRLKYFGENTWFELLPERFRVQFSAPLDPVGFSGTFLNGIATGAIEFANGILSFRLDEVIIEGAAAPRIMRVLKYTLHRNLARVIGLSEILGPDVVKRCVLAISDAHLHFACAARSP